MTWTTLFSRFVRRYRSCYANFDTFVPKESDYSKILRKYHIDDCILGCMVFIFYETELLEANGTSYPAYSVVYIERNNNAPLLAGRVWNDIRNGAHLCNDEELTVGY